MDDNLFFDEEPDNVDKSLGDIDESTNIDVNETIQVEENPVSTDRIGIEVVEEANTETVVAEQVDGESIAKEIFEEDNVESENTEGIDGEHVEGENLKSEELFAEDEILTGEHEQLEGEEVEEQKKEEVQEYVIEEEDETYVEEPPPDPAAPLNFSYSSEALKPPFELRPDQLAEVEQLWELYQDYTPSYTDIDGYITEKELVYMLKSLILMTYTPEQLQELIEYCVRPPHPNGHINYDQFLKMVTLRQRDFPVEEELRSSIQVLDPDRTGSVDREALKDMLANKGHKMTQRQLDKLIKEVDISNDGTIGVEDVVGTMCIDLNTEDIQLLRSTLYPDENPKTAQEGEF